MSGHSKWSKVKHQKETTDAAKSAAFTRVFRGITIAVREGGGMADPDVNFRLRLAIEKAKSVNMPKENIERAIAKGKGVGEGDIIRITYEAFGPHSSAMLIEAATDNKQRTVSVIKNILERHGGTLASPGAVVYMFRQCGLIVIPKTLSFDDVYSLALEAGADDVAEYDTVYEIYTKPALLGQVKDHIANSKQEIETSQLVMQPINPISLRPEEFKRVESLIERIKELDDIQEVYTNAASGD